MLFRQKHKSYIVHGRNRRVASSKHVLRAGQWIPVLTLLFCLYAVPVAAAPPVVQLNTVLTKVNDGTAPFVSVDPNGNNGLLATLDTANYTFDVSINTLDAQPHVVQNVTITSALTSSSADVSWTLSSLPAACATKTLSPDGKTMTCVLGGTFNTGTALNISGAWFGSSKVPDNTDVDVQFSVSANMVADSSGADNPTTATSTTDTVTVVSEPGNYEVRKQPGTTKIIRDSNGDPEFMQVTWGVQVEVVNPDTTQVKGTSALHLGDLELTDTLAGSDANQASINANAELVECRAAINSDGNVATSSSGTVSTANAVEDSGTWSCAQPGGPGTNIDMSATGIEWNPRWFPNGKAANATSYWSLNSTNIPNDTYNSPSGQNNQAVVATQIVTMNYPFQDILDFDNSPGDRNPTANFISWCNSIDDISVVGGNNTVDDETNNQACSQYNYSFGLAVNTGKYFLKYQGVLGQTPEQELGLTQGAIGPGASDNYLVADQRFAQAQVAGVEATVAESIKNFTSCDAIDQTKYNLIPYGSPALPGGSVGAAHSWYGWYRQGTPDPVFPAITDSDVVVEFATTGTTWANSSAQRTANCDDGSLSWVSDPSTLPGGLASANLVRVRLLKDLPPGVTIVFMQSLQAKPSLTVGTRMFNFAQYQASNVSSGAWVQANAPCLPENDPWGSTSGSYGCKGLADRAFTIAPTAIMQKYDGVAISDNINSVTLGGTWTYHLKAGMAYNVDVDIEGVSVYDVLPPGLDFVSATITPTDNVYDCNAAINPTCLTNPAARTNYGYRTLRWDRGDFTFTHSGGPETPSQDYDLFGSIDVTTRIASYVPNAATLQNKAWIDADNGLQPLPNPIPFRTTGTTEHNDFTSGPFDDDWVRITTAQSFNIEKYTSDSEIPLSGTLHYNLAFGNLSGASKVMDSIDIFPWEGDGRSPASAIDGGFSLAKAQETLSSGLINAIYVTAATPNTLSDDPNDNPTVGTGIWSCTYGQLGTSGCPTADQVTAIRIVSNSLTAGQYGMIRVELTTNDNDGAEVYTNNWQARATTLALPMISSDVTAHTPNCLEVGNLVFEDANKNARFDSGEQGIEGVLIELVRDGDNEVYKTTFSDADGRWKISCIAPDEYYVRIPASNFEDGGALAGHAVASSGNAADGQDETDDQDLDDIDGVFRTQTFTVSYDNPLGEFGADDDTDAFDNLTIDLGVVLAASNTPTNPTSPSSPAGNTGGLGETGQRIATGLIALVGITALYLLTHIKRQRNYRLGR